MNRAIIDNNRLQNSIMVEYSSWTGGQMALSVGDTQIRLLRMDLFGEKTPYKRCVTTPNVTHFLTLQFIHIQRHVVGITWDLNNTLYASEAGRLEMRNQYKNQGELGCQ